MSRWEGVAAPRLRAGDIAALLDGTLAYLRVPRFLEPARCAELSSRFLAGPRPLYERRDYGVVQTLELGHMLASLPKQEARYFAEAPALAARLREFYAGTDPLARLRDAFAEATGWSCVEARAGGRAYLTDFIWGFPPGATVPLHEDSAALMDRAAGASGAFERHLTWNAYLSVSERGGLFRVYRRRRRPGDEGFKLEPHGYAAGVVAGAERAECAPEAGDLILFDAENYHEVTRVEGARARIAGHSFLGVSPGRGEFGFWI